MVRSVQCNVERTETRKWLSRKFNSVTRIGESDADTFSLERVNEPDGLAKALVKTIDYRAATPSALEETLFYSHPSVGSRVRKAMEWKARHPK